MTNTRVVILLVFGGAILTFGVMTALAQKEYKSGIVFPEPVVVTPGKTDSEPPSDAIVKGSDILTKDSFGDYQLHLEFATPEKVVGKGQGRGNSGVFLANRYEVQVLDSFDNKTYFDGQCASLYKQTPP